MAVEATAGRAPWAGLLRWPLPALLCWGGAWLTFAGLRAAGAPALAAAGAAALIGAALSVCGSTPWRRVFIALGFPLSLASSGLAGAASGVFGSGWLWLLPLGALALVYPLNTWRDAPMFPTPRGALAGLAGQVRLPDSARVLDAGCGLGDGLLALRSAYPHARLEGLEWSWPLRLACGWRCRFAAVRRGDIWAANWSGYDMVYLFQRPESMPRAMAKAASELRPGAWLASLEFDAVGFEPTQVLTCAGGRRLWLYQAPLRGSPVAAPPAGRYAKPKVGARVKAQAPARR